MGRPLAIALLALALVAAGCGGGTKSNGESKKPPDQVVRDAQQAALGANAVHVSGKIVDSGVPLTLDLHLASGKGKGSMSENKLSFDVVRVGGKVYIRGSDAFLRRFAGSAAATLLHGKWLYTSEKQGQLAALAPLTDTRQLFKSALGQHGTLKNLGETTYKGQKVVAIKDTTEGGTLYVAATGTPYPLAIEGGQEHGSITFDNWNEKVSITAPPGAVDLSKLPG